MVLITQDHKELQRALMCPKEKKEKKMKKENWSSSDWFLPKLVTLESPVDNDMFSDI